MSEFRPLLPQETTSRIRMNPESQRKLEILFADYREVCGQPFNHFFGNNILDSKD